MENGREVIHDYSSLCMDNARRLGIDAMIVIGGDGTQHIACDFYREGVNIVGVPKTIDNDLDATEVTFGFDTALVIATEAVDRLHTTAESHHRVMLIEVVGRDAGWIALHAGIAGGAHIILVPEVPVHL
jgi:ATP-dependent phosphofructokinase / diphosphate-dependent phosphofructokinase